MYNHNNFGQRQESFTADGKREGLATSNQTILQGDIGVRGSQLS